MRASHIAPGENGRQGQEEEDAPVAKGYDTKPVKGGWVTRDASTGRFIEVRTEKGVSRSSSETRTTVKEASSRRSAALKRLADR